MLMISTLYTVGKNIVDLKHDLNADAQNMTNWFHNNRLMLNVSKSHSMLICNHQKRIHLSEIDLNIMMLNNEIQTVDSIKLLGVYVDHNLRWQNHINSIQKRLVSLIGLLYRIRPFLDKASMLLFYNAYVLPVLDYCISIWGHSAEIHMHKLQILQNRAASIILNANWYTSSEILLKELNWMSVKQRLFYCTSVLMYDVINETAPDSLRVFRQRDCTYGLRFSQNLVIPSARVDMYKSSFSFYGAKCWNTIPDYIKESQTKQLFKMALMKHILT